MTSLKLVLLGIVVNLVQFGLLLQLDDIKHYRPSEAYLVENTLQPSEQEVPLEDFFWTGSGDGPPYVKPKDSSGHDVKYPNTIVRTATILATVYIDGNYDSDFDPLCIYDCDKKPEESGIVESFDNIPPSDRRYWLLTVVAGLFGPQDFPILEEKLAKLYRIAFLRQQAQHLGIANGNNSTRVNETVLERKKRHIDDEKVVISPTKTFNGSEKVVTRRFEINRHVYERQVLRMKLQRTKVKRESQSADFSDKTKPSDVIYQNRGSANRSRKLPRNFMQKVTVMIHSVNHGDFEKDFVGSNKIDVPNDHGNQTEIIYSVVVGGKPILASTAAHDMKLVKLDEVVKIIEKDVVLKAEPYLKEPQATPLIPSYMNGANVVTTYVNQNPLLIFLSSIALLLFILLLITLLLYGRSKRRLASEAKRNNATQVLVQKIQVDEDIHTIRSDSLEGVGVDNLAFIKESTDKNGKEPPILHFPLPPPNRPPSSTSSTSDSSVYYPKRRFKFNSIQDLLEAKDEELYTKIQNKEKTMKKDGKVIKQSRNRRKYRTENRVGSIEQVDVHSYQSDGDGFNDESLLQLQQEHNEAFNPNVSHYNANKIMTNKAFTVIETERERGRRSNEAKSQAKAEAINKGLIQHHSRIKSADSNSNSIGSFLSMASIRSFPKCSVPEPLSRVLEPVSVTHLDHSDADHDTLKNYRMMDSQKSLNFDEMDDEKMLGAEAQSDGGDPGVVGPVVWEMHKKGFDLSTNSLSSPLRDPLSTRNRFEGLLSGAIYGSSSYSNCHSLLNQPDDIMPGVIKSKEARGKSAATIRLTSTTSGLLSRADFNPPRPMTAGPDVQPSPQFSVPTIRAWTSGSGPLVRPLSAGVYHKPELSAVDEKSQTDRSKSIDKSSPIIDAIQKELKRISNEEK